MVSHHPGDTLSSASALNASRLESVRTRRVLAFLIDYLAISVMFLISIIPVFLLGIVTFGAGWLLFPVLGLLVAAAYIGSTMGGPNQATWGMNFFALRIERLDGKPVDGITAIVHGILFWVAHVTLTPLLLVVSLFNSRKQLVQDILLGTVIVRSDRHA
ncbi:MAG: RDD family protein [Rhizobiaceae bacterium]